MKRLINCVVIIVLCFGFVVSAQDDNLPPDYRVSTTTDPIEITDDEVIVTVTIFNSGADSTVQTVAELSDIRAGSVLATQDIPPLTSGQSLPITLRFNWAGFTPETNLTLWVTVDSDNLNGETNSTLFNNNTTLPLITFPSAEPDSTEGLQEVDGTESTIITVPVIDTQIDTGDRDQMVVVLAILALVVIMTIILLLIVRVLTRRRPTFGNWHPPYATMPPMDPNSSYGRRQLWQQHAQNNTVPSTSVDGSVHARKLLLGMDGYYLSGWKISALRLTQYDMYGRVARSEVLATSRQIKGLNRVARKIENLTEEQITRRVRWIARQLAKELKDKIRKRSAVLAIALDVRLEGVHGEVRIIFELYQYGNQRFQQIDQWEPEMQVTSRTIYEAYTYTLYGQTGAETYKEFRGRLVDDIVGALTVMFMSQVPGGTGVVTSANTQPVDINAETPM